MEKNKCRGAVMFLGVRMKGHVQSGMKRDNLFGWRGRKIDKNRVQFKNGPSGKPKTILDDVRKIMNTPGIQYRLNSQDVTEIKTLLRRITEGHDVGLKTGEHGLVIGTCHDMLRKWDRENPGIAAGKAGKSGGAKADTFAEEYSQKLAEAKNKLQPQQQGVRGAITEFNKESVKKLFANVKVVADRGLIINKLGTNEIKALRKYMKEHTEDYGRYDTLPYCETALITREFRGDFLGGASQIIARNGTFGELNKFIDRFWDRMVGEGYEARGIYEAIDQLTLNPDNWQGRNVVKYRQYLNNAWRRLYKRR